VNSHYVSYQTVAARIFTQTPVNAARLVQRHLTYFVTVSRRG